MENDGRRQRAAETDDFWDVDALIPQRRVPQYAHDIETVEITSEAQGDLQVQPSVEPIPPRCDEPKRRFIPPHTAEEEMQAPPPDAEYTPENSLIRTVRLYRRKNTYRYYDDFVRDAARLYAVKGEECPHIPFFSYVPQYVQMNRGQLEWYLWWRENFRHDKLLTTDYSYLLLYAYEVINLAGRMEPTEAQHALCRLWLGYRTVFHQLDGYLPEWICDLSLIHRLPPPREFTGQDLFTAMSRCTLKEFYITASGNEGVIRGLPVFCSNYDFHKSKFCTEEHKPLFESMIYGALREVGCKTGKNGGLFNMDGMDVGHMVRISYQGALCAQSVQRRIVIDYTSFSCSCELRYLVTDVIKYAENRIRAYIGVRSRLSICELSATVRTMIDAYFDAHLPQKERSASQKAAEPELYERLYDLPRVPLSVSRALAIEHASWETTEQLVEAFDEDTGAASEKVPPVQVPEPPSSDANGTDDPRTAFRPYLPFLKAALEADPARQRAVAKTLGKMSDAVADRINELATTYTGDVLLEDTGDGYGVIEDYRDFARSLIE